MAKVVLDVPAEKMQSFLNAVLNLGIDRRSIQSGNGHNTDLVIQRSLLHRIATSFILFDWEFFSNELEYE
jgi:hypothetical protein